jgi:hypothetical protein
MSYTIRGIPYFLIDRFWSFAVPYIKRALDHTNGEFYLEDILERCHSRDMQLWLISHDASRIVGAGVTEIVQHPRRTYCRIVTLSGSKFSEWASIVEPTIEQFAISNGCDGIEAWVRRGFVPTLKQSGYKPFYVTVVKDIKHVELDSTKQPETENQL